MLWLQCRHLDRTKRRSAEERAGFLDNLSLKLFSEVSTGSLYDHSVEETLNSMMKPTAH